MIRIDKKILSKTARAEGVSTNELSRGIAAGTLVIPANNRRDIPKPCAIGLGTSTKVNANIGLSQGHSDVRGELSKLDMAVKTGADTVMDLSTGPLVGKVRKKVLSKCVVPLGTVPVYELACVPGKDFMSMNEDDFISVVKAQAEEGVDFFTIHSGITLEAVEFIIGNNPRILNIVSRGGALMAAWMAANKRENPFLTRFDEVIDIARRHNICLSLGDSLRPGAIRDAGDRLQIQELVRLGEQQQRALSRGAQVMIEGPGHVQLDQIEANVRMQKTICHGAPFYVLGPLVTDAAPGYDHITGAIGGAIAASNGADFLCYVTPAEHLRLPDIEDVRKGVMASRIAAHAADIVKGVPAARKRDEEISRARARRDWDRQYELALDPGLAARMKNSAHLKKGDACTMCGDFCSIKTAEGLLKPSGRGKARKG